MFQLTHAAADQVTRTRQAQGFPETFGLRVFGERESDGGMALKLAFTETPARNDQVTEQEGTRLFVAPEVAGPLSFAALDVEPTVDGPKLVLIDQDAETPD